MAVRAAHAAIGAAVLGGGGGAIDALALARHFERVLARPPRVFVLVGGAGDCKLYGGSHEATGCSLPSGGGTAVPVSNGDSATEDVVFAPRVEADTEVEGYVLGEPLQAPLLQQSSPLGEGGVPGGEPYGKGGVLAVDREALAGPAPVATRNRFNLLWADLPDESSEGGAVLLTDEDSGLRQYECGVASRGKPLDLAATARCGDDFGGDAPLGTASRRRRRGHRHRGREPTPPPAPCSSSVPKRVPGGLRRRRV